MKASRSIKRVIAIGIVGAMAICEILPASAAPVLSNTALVKMSAPDMLDQVRVRRGIGPAVALGVLGAVAGAALQNRYYYGSGYYGSGYYGPGYYGGGYGGPGYYGGYAGPGYYGPYGAYPSPYGYNYNYGYGYGYDRSGAVAAGAAIGAIGAIMGAAARNPGAYRRGGYQYYDAHRPW